MKPLLSFVFLYFLLISSAFSQESKIAVHIYNPLAFFQKAGLKLELRQKKMGVLITGIQYYGSLPKYPGTQVGIEGRYYNKLQSARVHQNFAYSKFYYGFQQAVNKSGDGFFYRAAVPAGSYYGAGVGVGRHFNYRFFFLDFNAGLKFTVSEVKQDKAFYITGPASYLDLHFNLGFQL